MLDAEGFWKLPEETGVWFVLSDGNILADVPRLSAEPVMFDCSRGGVYMLECNGNTSDFSI